MRLGRAPIEGLFELREEPGTPKGERPLGRKHRLFPCVISGYVRGNINSGAGTSKTRVDRAAQANATLAYVCFWSGFVDGISIGLTGTVGGTSYEGEVYVNGVATGILVTVDAADSKGQAATAAPYPVNPGDTIDVYDKRTGAVNGRAAEHFVHCRFAVAGEGSGGFSGGGLTASPAEDDSGGVG